MRKSKDVDPAKTARQAEKRVPQSFIKAAEDFEVLKIEEVKKSRKVAWIVAGAAGVVGVVGVITALVALLMRTEPEPVVLKVATETGATTILRSIRDDKDQFDEVVNKYWLSQYVLNCEGYDWYTIGNQFEACKLMSSDEVATQQDRKVRAPTAPLSVLKDKGRVSIKIVSIVPNGDVSQVRFTSEKVSPSGENLDQSPVQKWMATIAFQFKPGQMTEQQRLVNPLGFKALSYRVDPEVLK